MANQMNAVVDKLLTNVSNGYMPTGFISELILPMISTAQYSGKLAGYGSNHIRLENALAGGEGAYRRVEPISTSDQNYNIDSFGLEAFVTARDKSNFENPYDAERDKVLGLTSMIYIGKEKSLADSLSDVSVMTQNTTLAGPDQWSDYSNSDPIGDVNTAVNTIVDATGAMPNFLTMDMTTSRILKYHPQLLDSLGFKDSRPGGLTAEEIAKAFDVERVYISQARYDSSAEGQTSSFGAIWGKDVVLGVAPSTPTPWQTSLGYRVQKSGSMPRRVYKYAVNNPPDATGIIVDDEYSFFLSNVKAGYLIKDAVA